MRENSAFASILFALSLLAVTIGFAALASEHVDQDTSPVFVKEIPPGYRDWKVVTVSHEADELNDIRAVLGNEIAIKAYRENKLPFPEGAIVGRIAWSYIPSEEFNKTFGKEQSFVAGPPTEAYLQFMVKDSKKVWGDRRLGILILRSEPQTYGREADAKLFSLSPGRQRSRLYLQPLHALSTPRLEVV